MRIFLKIKKPSLFFKPLGLLKNGLTPDYYFPGILCLACFDGIEGLNNTQNTFEAHLERCSNTGLERQMARGSVDVVP